MPNRTPVSIIVPAYNELPHCKACVRAVRRCTYRPHQLILVNNGSTDGIAGYIDRLEGVEAVHAPANRGFAAGINKGLARASGHVCILHSDVVVTPGWLDALVEAMLQRDTIGLAGPVTNWARPPQRIDGLQFHSEAQVASFAQAWTAGNGNTDLHVTRLGGFCMVIRDGVWQRLGEFDERFEPAGYEDDDYCTRARRAGYELLLVRGTFVYHRGGRSLSAMGIAGETMQAMLEANRRRYMEKWGIHLPDRNGAQDQREALRDEARARMRAGRLEGAAALYQNAIAAAPDTAEGYNELGEVLWQQGRLEAAYDLFLEALYRDLTCAPALKNAVNAAIKLERSPHLEAQLRAWCNGLVTDGDSARDPGATPV